MYLNTCFIFFTCKGNQYKAGRVLLEWDQSHDVSVLYTTGNTQLLEVAIGSTALLNGASGAFCANVCVGDLGVLGRAAL